MFLLILIFFIRVIFDVFYKSIGEKLEDIFLKSAVEKNTTEYETQKIIGEKVIDALKNGDHESYTYYDTLRKEYRNEK